ncbi:MAG TPA: glutamate--tRNA ligase, partial [Chloroflexota bacterium]|nr:glutamate--tRNA ligase [Chloroflexota bacterium]
QSERLPVYQRYAEQLIDAGHAYRCWCTPERLTAVREAQRARNEAPRYDRFCLGKSRQERSLEPGFSERPVIRMLVPENPPIEFDDLIRGRIGAPTPDDQVLLKGDGFPTYHLAVVVDDHEMEITHVTRGEEWISSTPKHLLLYEWFGWTPPAIAHFPLLRNTDHSKISKRKNPAARLLWFKEQGFLPEALVNFLALMGWSLPDGREKFAFADLVENFSWDRFSLGGSVFDIDKLDWLNGQYIQGLSEADFLERIGPFLKSGADPGVLRPLVAPLQERTRRLSEIWDQVEYIYADDLAVDRTLLTKQGLDATIAEDALAEAERIVTAIEPLTPDGLEAEFNAETERRGWKRRAFFMTVRVAATGRTVTPPLFDTIVALGREKTLARLRRAREALKPVVAS